MKEVFQLHISLEKSDPLIWRKVLVHRDTDFFKLHHIVQIVMGWENYHLFEFNLSGYRIGQVDKEAEGFGNDELLDSESVKLSDMITQVGDSFQYLYDFGDNWKHLVRIESELDLDSTYKYPVCIDGQMNCPPEDSGGILSFYYSLEALKDKRHPAHAETKSWFKNRYKPEKFDQMKANRVLGTIDKYIRKWKFGGY